MQCQIMSLQGHPLYVPKLENKNSKYYIRTEKGKQLPKGDVNTFFRTPSRTRSSIAGTAVINVGANIEASPFVPFLILFDVSVRVKGDPYPIAPPAAAITAYTGYRNQLAVICQKCLIMVHSK